MKHFKISILIPSWNGEKYIKNCLESLLENEYDNFQVISIAGGNDDAYEISKSIQKKYPDKLIPLSRKEGKKNEALNVGLKKASGDIIIITDVDCIYPNDWLSKINKIFQDREINVITSLNLPYDERYNSLSEFNRIRVGYNLLKYESGKIIPGNKLWGGCTAFRKEVFLEKIGRFETESITGDDKILGMQFNEEGVDVYFFREIYVFTEHYSNDLKRFINQRVRWARDLLININFKNLLQAFIHLMIGAFKLFYPFIVFVIWIFFYNSSLSLFLIFLSPWIIFYILWLIGIFLELNYKSKEVNSKLKIDLDVWKAFKISSLMFFVFGYISVKSFVNPFGRQWYH